MPDKVTIPSQSYYNIVVYDLDPDGLNAFFASSVGMSSEELKELAELGLEFLGDRVEDGTHSTEDDRMPDPDDIRSKIRLLEKWRKKFSDEEPDNYLDFEV